MEKTPLLGKTPAELKAVAIAAGLPPFTGNQLARWLYVKRARSIDEMTDISKAGREKLQESFTVGITEPLGSQISRDGTRKYLFPTGDGKAVEAVMIPEAERKTLCVSSQQGCKMGCKFCMTGRQGFHGNLSAAQILSQFLAIEEAEGLTNAVFMGMGEPLDNWEEVKRAIEVICAPWGFAWSPKRVTLSSIGVLPKLKLFLDESRCHLAISLHNPFHGERLEMMPSEKAWPLESIIELLEQYDFSGQRRVSFEYTVFEGWNDTPRHAEALIGLLRHLECRVNLIRFHSIPDFPLKAASSTRMEDFRGRLERGGLTATIRASRGEDIMAACGLLAGSLAK